MLCNLIKFAKNTKNRIIFLEKFEYIDADYKYRAEYKTYISPGGIDKSFLFVEYEPEIYLQAKNFCLQELMLSDLLSEQLTNLRTQFPLPRREK